MNIKLNESEIKDKILACCIPAYRLNIIRKMLQQNEIILL